MALSDETIKQMAINSGLELGGVIVNSTRFQTSCTVEQTRFARAIEAEVRKQDEALIRQMLEALTDIVEAGEEAWGEDRPCVRIGKKEITAARTRLGITNG